jgi:hypothetical protein
MFVGFCCLIWLNCWYSYCWLVFPFVWPCGFWFLCRLWVLGSDFWYGLMLSYLVDLFYLACAGISCCCWFVLLYLSVSPYELFVTVPVTGTTLGPVLSFCLPCCGLFTCYLCRILFLLVIGLFVVIPCLFVSSGTYCWAMINWAKGIIIGNLD